jgi:hypothetical protein
MPFIRKSLQNPIGAPRHASITRAHDQPEKSNVLMSRG